VYNVFLILCCNEVLTFFNVSFQFTEATRNGPVGLIVVSLVVWEENTIIVSAQILGQHTEDEGVAALACLQKHRLVTFSGAQVQVHAKKSNESINLL